MPSSRPERSGETPAFRFLHLPFTFTRAAFSNLIPNSRAPIPPISGTWTNKFTPNPSLHPSSPQPSKQAAVSQHLPIALQAPPMKHRGDAYEPIPTIRQHHTHLIRLIRNHVDSRNQRSLHPGTLLRHQHQPSPRSIVPNPNPRRRQTPRILHHRRPIHLHRAAQHPLQLLLRDTARPIDHPRTHIQHRRLHPHRRSPSIQHRIDPPIQIFSSTCAAVVGLILPNRFALGAATGTPARRISSSATGCPGIRTPTSRLPAVTASGTVKVLGSNKVNGPGQNLSTNIIFNILAPANPAPEPPLPSISRIRDMHDQRIPHPAAPSRRKDLHHRLCIQRIRLQSIHRLRRETLPSPHPAAVQAARTSPSISRQPYCFSIK